MVSSMPGITPRAPGVARSSHGTVSVRSDPPMDLHKVFLLALHLAWSTETLLYSQYDSPEKKMRAPVAAPRPAAEAEELFRKPAMNTRCLRSNAEAKYRNIAQQLERFCEELGDWSPEGKAQAARQW